MNCPNCAALMDPQDSGTWNARWVCPFDGQTMWPDNTTYDAEHKRCDGNCETDLADCDGYWTVSTPRSEDLNFCSPECIDSWLATELAAR